MKAGIFNNYFNAIKAGLFWGLTLFVLSVSNAYAIEGTDANDVFRSIGNSIADFPGLVSAVAYILGITFGVMGVLKLKEHVENANQTPLRVPIARLLIGGALLALPMTYTAMVNTITGGIEGNITTDDSAATWFSGLIGTLNSIFPTFDIGNVLANIIDAISELPNLIAAFSYLLGLVIGFMGLIKLKDHIENPDQNPLREGVVRILAAGALLSLPTILSAMQALIGELNTWGQIGSGLGILGFFTSDSGFTCNPVTEAFEAAIPIFAEQPTVGGAMCNIITRAGAFPAFLTALGYIFGVYLGFTGILKIRDHVLQPTQVKMWDGVSRFLAGGAFLALPAFVEIVKNTVQPQSLSFEGLLGTIVGVGGAVLDFIGGFLGQGEEKGQLIGNPCEGLDGALMCFVSDISGPFHSMLNFFAFVAGMILVMIGISRLMKSEQDGPRGPAGMGTLMTFLAAGALMSYNSMVEAFGNSFFNTAFKWNYGATLQYQDGMEPGELTHATAVIEAVMTFLLIVGLISFIRGIFIVRDVAEGNQQASVMAGVTHLIGGALAVNLGPLLNAVQTTLGITGYGVTFS